MCVCACVCVCVQVMENSERTAILHVLLGFLRRAHPSVCVESPSSPFVSTAFVELVIRCFSKLIRTFQSQGMFHIDMERLLRDVHDYLSLPPAPSSSSSSSVNADVGGSPEQAARAVRSILALMVQVKGEALLHEAAVTLPSDSPATAAVERAVSNWKAKHGAATMQGSQLFTPNHCSATLSRPEPVTVQTPTLPALNNTQQLHTRTMQQHSQHAPPAAPHTQTNTARPLTAAVKGDQSPPVSGGGSNELCALVSAVLTPSTTRAGLSALAAFAAANPSVDVMDAFSGQSESFRAYVQRHIHTKAASTATVTRPQSAGPNGVQHSQSHPLHSHIAATHARSGSASTDALRERLQALQSKARTVNAAPAPSPTPTSAPFSSSSPSPSSSSSPPLSDGVRVPSAAAETALAGRPPSGPSLAGSRLSLTSQSMDAIKQRFAAIHNQRQSGQPLSSRQP